MRIFKHCNFSKWAKNEKITDKALQNAITELINGLFEANLGGGLYKKRIARRGYGKRGGYRTIIAFKQNDRAVFIFGFAKNERENIDDTEKEILKNLADYYLNSSNESLEVLLAINKLIEVKK